MVILTIRNFLTDHVFLVQRFNYCQIFWDFIPLFC